MKIFWSDSAKKDLRAIKQYIARDSVFYADRMIERIAKNVGNLSPEPKRGHRVHEYPENENLREIHETPYRIIYLHENPGQVVIVAIVHFARQFKLPPKTKTKQR